MLARGGCVLLGHSRGRWRRCSVMILGLFLGGWWLVAGGCGVRLGSLKGCCSIIIPLSVVFFQNQRASSVF